MKQKGLEDKAIRMLQELVRINTSNEEAEEYQAAIYIQELLKEYPIDIEIVYSPEGRANVIASVRAAQPTEERLVLLSHLDVVAPGEKEWTYPPFSGKEAEGCIWGRGTLDTKQLTVMHLIALLEISEKRANLNRDVYLISTADEENGSKEGMEFLANERPELFAGATVLSEGGGFTLSDGEGHYMLYASGEKGNTMVKLMATGDGGHAGSPPENQAIHHIATTLQHLFMQESKTENYPILQAFEQAFAPLLYREQVDEAHTFLPKLHEYMKYETCTVDNIKLGETINVIPYKGEVYIEFRTLPFTSKDQFTKKLSELLGDQPVEWEIIHFQRGYESDIHHDIVQLFEKYSATYGFTGQWVPFTALGKTDGRFISTIAKDIYGISPVTIPFADVLTRVHSVDERIEVEAFLYGVHLMRKVVTAFCLHE